MGPCSSKSKERPVMQIYVDQPGMKPQMSNLIMRAKDEYGTEDGSNEDRE